MIKLLLLTLSGLLYATLLIGMGLLLVAVAKKEVEQLNDL